jgi:predicted TIM-barrel fold metal-dependent hydrolase
MSNERVSTDRTVVDADGHVEPALVLDWARAIGGDQGARVNAAAQRWFDQVGHGSSTRPGAWDPRARLVDMDADGIDTAVLFGSSRGPASVSAGDAELEPLVARAFNDWLADYCTVDNRRLKAAAWVPLLDIDAACAEAQRSVEQLGAVGVVVNPCTGDYALDDPRFFPLYDVLQSLDVPALVHGTGAVGDFLTRRYHTHMRRHAVAFPLSLQMATMDIVCGGVLERFDRLRVAVFEGGAGWVPWWIDRLDEHHELAPYASPFITDKPSRLIARYIDEARLFWSCEPDEALLGAAVEQLGPQAIVFASDYPHVDCTFPGAVDAVADRADLDDAAKHGLLAANAHALYGARLS